MSKKKRLYKMKYFSHLVELPTKPELPQEQRNVPLQAQTCLWTMSPTELSLL